MNNNYQLTVLNRRAVFAFYLFFIIPFLLSFTNVCVASVVGTQSDPENINKILICHVPNGAFDQSYTISLTTVALGVHLNHLDDYEGGCVSPGIKAPAVECSAPLGTHLRFNFSNPIRITNQRNANLGQVGTVFRFRNVTTNIDALVEVIANNNARLLRIDVPSLEEDPLGTGLKWSFQPEIQPINRAAGKYYIDFKISFVSKNTTFPSQIVKKSGFVATVADIDSDGVNRSLKEFVELNGFYQYFVETPNNLTHYASTLLGTSKGFEAKTAANLAGITVFNTPSTPNASKHIVTFQYQQANSFIYRAGINFTSPYSANADKRLFSLFFNCPEYIKPTSSMASVARQFDYGDAPSSYGDARHALPIVPNTSLIYLGSLPPDAETLTLNTLNRGADGTGDDSDARDDEDAVSQFPVLYSDAAHYTMPLTSIKVNNQSGRKGVLYGYADFNRDGDFNDAGETTTVVVNNNATQPVSDLVWSGFSPLTTGRIYVRFRISTDTGLTAAGIASDGEVEDYHVLSVVTPPTCSVLSGEINGGLFTPAKLVAGNTLFLASSTLSNATGHLKAYRVDNQGLPDLEIWDAANAMAIQNERAIRLFSTAPNGRLIRFSALNNTFLSTRMPLKGRTFKGTVATAAMGMISPQSNLAVIDNTMHIAHYLTSNGYKMFYNKTISKRAATNGASKPARILVTSDDGFLYAFDQYSGDLGWGWMPRSLAAVLNHSTSFRSNHMMQGKIAIMDVKSASGYSSYVVGSYKQGLGHYVLKLNADSSLGGVIWDTDHTNDRVPATRAPNQGQPIYFFDVNETPYIAYVTTDVTDVSTLHIRNIVDASVHKQVVLNFTATSMPYIMRDFGSVYAPTKKMLYLGDSIGNIHAANLLTKNGATLGILESVTNIATELNNVTVATLNTSASTPVLFIGAAGLSTNRAFYLYAQSSDRFSVFKYDAVNTVWQAEWTTYIGGAGMWLNGSLSTKATIQRLPMGSTLTDNAFVIANSIVLPVSLPSSNNGCYNEAFYYFYRLTDGSMPAQTFLRTSDQSFIGGTLSLGNGNARALQVSKIRGNRLLLGFGMADQKMDLTTISGINKTFYIHEPRAKILRGRRELRK